jgi:hypothetical protein
MAEQPVPSEPWDLAEALRLMEAADDLVKQSGVPGTHPDIRAAAGRCVEAHRLQDMGGVRAACAEIMEIVGMLIGNEEP